MISGIPKDKLKALLAEGFSEEYLARIMQVLPDADDPNLDLNEEARAALGLTRAIKTNPVAMTASFSPIPNSGFNRGKRSKRR